MKKIFVIILFPLVTFAEGLTDIMASALNIVNNVLIPLAFSLCLLYFFWGVVKYIKTEGQGKAEGKGVMIWGIVGLFVAVSVWGIVSFIRSELQLPGIDNIERPTSESPNVTTDTTFGGLANP